nr:unnamed protein product [Callosobruchus analis]CAI5866981.1 unnamed protein product [Callosobruchus analis]
MYLLFIFLQAQALMILSIS